MIRWRELLTHLSIPWIDHGRNVRRGWLAIKCPWCGNTDPSQHLGINEEQGHYHCLRAPGHSGKSPYFLLNALGVRGHELDELVTLYGGTTRRLFTERVALPTSPFAKRWATFRPAILDAEARAYLKSRGFWNPERTAARYDLRTAPGRYAGRLWFPFYYGNEVAGFTGRSMRGGEPRYLHESAASYLYLPRLPYESDKITLLVEGPIDALRLADAIEDRYDILVVALCGLTIGPEKHLQLWALAKLIPTLFVVPDSTVSVTDANRLRRELHTLAYGHGVREARVRRLDLPPGTDDPGEMNGEDIELWLRQTGIAELTKM